MDTQEFKEFGKAMVDYIANYRETLRERKVLPSVEPGYLQPLLPDEAPQKPEPWQEILKDVDRFIMPGVTHWQSPNFHAYYPCGGSFPSIVGDMLSGAISCIGFSWMSGPACTELEVQMMNWLGKMLHLPEEFLNCSEGPGGGVIQGSASEASLLALLVTKEKFVRSIRNVHPEISPAEIHGKLVAYSSDQSNSSVEKAGIISNMKMKLLPADENGILRGTKLQDAIRKDKEAGLIPCVFIACLGTTGTCAFDNLEELGPVCHEENVWLHIDAAYAATAFICPEYRHLMNGVEYADSFNFNPHKWMLTNFDCSCMWIKDARYLLDAFNVERIYLKHNKVSNLPEYRHWQIPLGRRFRALKLWFVLRCYGVEGIQAHVRRDIAMAKYFESLLRSDHRFEVCTSSLSLITFRLNGDDKLTQKLLDNLTAAKNLYVIPCHYRSKLVIRFVIASEITEKRDIDFAWKEICNQTTNILAPQTKNKIEKKTVMRYKNYLVYRVFRRA